MSAGSCRTMTAGERVALSIPPGVHAYLVVHPEGDLDPVILLRVYDIEMDRWRARAWAHWEWEARLAQGPRLTLAPPDIGPDVPGGGAA